MAFAVGGGDLRYDEQDEQGADDMPSSRVIWYWTGWHPRTVTLALTISPPIGAGQGIEKFVSARRPPVQRFSRGMEPQRHSLIGPLPAALDMDSPFIIESFQARVGRRDGRNGDPDTAAGGRPRGRLR